MDRLTQVRFFSSALIILLSSSTALAVPSGALPWSRGYSCDNAVSLLSPCLNYLRKIEDKPSHSCCDGAERLSDNVRTVDDRHAVCQCFKEALSPISDVDLSRIPLIPPQCGIRENLPPIDRDVDCSMIH